MQLARRPHRQVGGGPHDVLQLGHRLRMHDHLRLAVGRAIPIGEQRGHARDPPAVLLPEERSGRLHVR